MSYRTNGVSGPRFPGAEPAAGLGAHSQVPGAWGGSDRALSVSLVQAVWLGPWLSLEAEPSGESSRRLACALSAEHPRRGEGAAGATVAPQRDLQRSLASRSRSPRSPPGASCAQPGPRLLSHGAPPTRWTSFRGSQGPSRGDTCWPAPSCSSFSGTTRTPRCPSPGTFTPARSGLRSHPADKDSEVQPFQSTRGTGCLTPSAPAPSAPSLSCETGWRGGHCRSGRGLRHGQGWGLGPGWLRKTCYAVAVTPPGGRHPSPEEPGGRQRLPLQRDPLRGPRGPCARLGGEHVGKGGARLSARGCRLAAQAAVRLKSRYRARGAPPGQDGTERRDGEGGAVRCSQRLALTTDEAVSCERVSSRTPPGWEVGGYGGRDGHDRPRVSSCHRLGWGGAGQSLHCPPLWVCRRLPT